MKTHTFKGGIHPPEMKELSKDCEITEAFPSTKTVSIPVTQGGAPNEPVVKVGDSVARGQVIARSDAFMSAPVHASIAGTVKKIEYRLTAPNVDAPCIVIQADDSGRTEFMPVLDPFTCPHDEAIARVRDAGIVGMGGASFPTHVKLNPPAGKTIDCVLCNAAECEPYLTIDYRLMKEQTAKLVDGLHIVVHVTGAQAGIIALENNKTDLMPALTEAISAAKLDSLLSVCVCKTKYPQGGEKSLIQAVTGREVPAGGLPADVGCVVDNVGTLCAISEAFREGKPLIDRPLTVSGGAATPKNLLVPVGTLVGDLIPEVVQMKGNVARILSGGPMMGYAMVNANFPVTKNMSGVLFLNAKEAPLYEETPCIGCGRCTKACPLHLTPVMMVRSIKENDYETAKKFGLMDCVECGSCAYVCPAKVKLVQRFRAGKSVVRAQMAAEKAKAEAKKASEGGK